MFTCVLVKGKGVWIRYNGRTLGPRCGTRKEPSVTFLGMENAVTALRGTKRKAEIIKMQRLRNSKTIVLPNRKTTSREIERFNNNPFALHFKAALKLFCKQVIESSQAANSLD